MADNVGGVSCSLKAFCVLFIPLVVIGVGVSIGIVFIIGSVKGKGQHYDLSLNETRILEYSATWCSAIGVQSPQVDTKLYLLEEPPKVADHDTFTISQHFEILTNNVQFYEFYLYPGSCIHISMCVADDSTDASFAFITSESSFKKWKKSGYLDSSYFDSSFQIVKHCDDDTHNFTAYITKEEDYYIVFLNNDPEGTVLVKAWYQFYRTTLTISRDNSRDSCSTSRTQDTCYLDTLYRKNEFLVLVVGLPPIPQDENSDELWLETYPIDLECCDRYTLYELMLFGLVMFSLFSSALIATVCVCLHKPAVEPETVSSSKHYGTKF